MLLNRFPAVWYRLCIPLDHVRELFVSQNVKPKYLLGVETWESRNQIFGHSKHHKHNAAK